MRRDSGPVTRELLLLGGGHAHVEVVRSWPSHAAPGVRVTLISRLGTAPYSGMLPGLIAGHYHEDDAQLELGPLCRRSGVDFLQATVTGLDLERRLVRCEGRPPLRFDLLSLNTGSTPDRHTVPGALEHAVPVKPVDGFLGALATWELALAQRPASGSPFRIVVVGGGAGGVELALALQHRLGGGDSTPGRLELHLVSASREVPAGHAASVQRRLTRALQSAGVQLHAGVRVVRVSAGQVHTDPAGRLPFEVLIWATEAAAPAWIRASGLATDARGFLCVEATLRSTSHPCVFGAGDVIELQGDPRPKSGVFAVRQGPVLAANLAASLLGAALVPYRPQPRFLSLISTGRRHAVASYGPFAWAGDWVWRWKDRIDRRWMAMYQSGGTMAGDTPDAASAMRCAGCGGKVGPEILHRALARLPVPRAADGAVWDRQQREDVSAVTVPPGLALVQSVDSFRAMLPDPWLVGRVAAVHALSDLHAKGAAPHSALATLTVPWGAPEVTEDLLYQVLAGAMEVFEAEGVNLLGGHTSEGPELAIGFTVNGFARAEELLPKAGARAGDRLLLTKPLGIGILLAAEMRASLIAAWRGPLVETLVQSNGPASRCLRQHGATACTDVTGFGLLGHLGEILRASNLAAELKVDRLPMLPGVRELVARGIQSSIAPANRSAAESLVAETTAAGWDALAWALLTDPQTSGGLLAAVPPDAAPACVEALGHLGCEAADLGTFVERGSGPWIRS